jgi:cytochrome c553
MKKRDPRLPAVAPQQVDEAFDPWEQGRPIPLFVIAVVFALGLWGILTYLSGYMSQNHAAEKLSGVASVAQTGSIHNKEAKALLNDVASAAGLSNADVETLNIVAQGKGQAWSCASCHGAVGQGNLTTPRLAGQPAEYLKKQLQDFASGLRSNESMAVVAKALSATEIDKVAQYYAQIDLRSSSLPSMGGDLARGKTLAQQGDWKTNVPACFSCHGMHGEGVAPGFPALAGQRPDYIFAQLAAWHAGERKNSPQALMDGIAQRMNPQDMRSVADYLGSLPPLPVLATESSKRTTEVQADVGKAPAQDAPQGHPKS